MRRKIEPIPKHAGIYRILVQDPITGKWGEPKRGCKFQAAPYVNKVRSKRSFNSFAEAKDYYVRCSAGIASPGLPAVKQNPGMTLKELINEWVEIWLPNKDLSTQLKYKGYLRHFDYLADKPVESIQPSDIDRWINHLKSPEYLDQSNSTRCDYAHEYGLLRSILNFYVSRFNRNWRIPLIKDHKPMLKVKEKPKKPKKDLNVDEFKKFISALQKICTGGDCEQFYYVALMQYAIYGRIQEGAALHFEDFDFDRKKILVRRKIQWFRHKGYADRIVDGSKKNGGKELPMSELAAKVFREWVMKTGIRSGLLFQREGKFLAYRDIQYRYNQALAAAGLPFTATHILRHASLSEFYNVCNDILATKEVAGHADLRSTMKYAKARDEKIAKAQSGMDAKLADILP